jgi:hypothetical protein
MRRRVAKLVVLMLFFLASTAIADDVTPATIPGTADLAVLERTPPSEERDLVAVRMRLPKLDDRTPLDATILVVENDRVVAVRQMILVASKVEGEIAFARACNAASMIPHGIVRLRERNHVTGRIETIDFPLVEAVEIEKM